MERYPILKHFVWLILAAWVYTLTFVFNNYWSQYASYKSVTASFQQSVTEREKSFTNWISDTALLGKLAEKEVTQGILSELKEKPFNVFIYNTQNSGRQLLFWSTNAVLPNTDHILYYPSGSFVKYGNGQYELLKRTVKLQNKEIEVVGLILLHEEFFIENLSLRKEYPGFSGLSGKMLLTKQPTPYVINGENGKPLMYFSPQVREPIYVFNWASFTVECLTVIFLVLFVSGFSSALIRRKKIIAGLVFFISLFFLLHFSVHHYGIPIALDQLPLFGSEKTSGPASSAQLKQTMINAFFGLWGTIFITRHTAYILDFLNTFPRVLKSILVAAFTVIIVCVHFVMIITIRNLYFNSSVAFDLTNFFSLNYTTVLSFFILFLLAVSHYMVMRFLVLAIIRFSGVKKLLVIILMAVTGLAILTYLLKSPYTVLLLFSLAWILLFFIVGTNRNIKAAPATAGTSVVWLLVYAVSISLLLNMLGESRLKTRTLSLSQSLLLQNDNTSEYLVKYAAGNIKRINWQNILNNCKDEQYCQQAKDSIIDLYFGGYLDRYSTGVYLFDRNGNGLHNEGSVSYESLNTLFTTQATATSYPNLSSFGESFDQFGYIIKQEIENQNSKVPIGHLFIVVRSVSPNNQAVAPELFKQIQDFAVDLPQGFSYAWYKNGSLVEQYRNYPFPVDLPAAVSDNISMWENEIPDAYELWLNAGAGKVLVLAAQRKISISFISMLAYMFGAFLLFYSVMAGLILLVRGKLFSAQNLQRYTFSLQSKIRATVIVILLTAFIIVAVVTISFFIGQFKSGNQDKLAKTVQDISTELMRLLPEGYENLPGENQQQLLNNLLFKVTTGQNVDANCFDSSGKLIASTQNIWFEKGVISPMVDPLVWWHLTKGQLNRYFSNEKIGRLSYISIYQPLRNKNNRIFAFLQVPYFASQRELNQEISNFLVILINIIAFVFLLSGGLAFWISGSITRSFNLIAEKMDRIRLSEHNERIEWSRNDEIGHLVSQYNKMVDQLEDSAAKMARSERELAWREMARQVAHEIKNPLTPMKLSLQFLQKAIREKYTDIPQITERVSGNLVSQIDHLSRIATEFSQFANLGNNRPEIFDLQHVIKEVIQLYELQENVKVQWKVLGQPLYINADKTQINRLFNNLFLNAIEAAGDDSSICIQISEHITPEGLLLSFKDNGMGIPSHVQPNIFVPNFTTKTSGTGLGLAICKAIVENAGGTIWFETENEVGTTFFIRLPLVDKK